MASATKNLLIIAYYFPPSGGPGVQRVLKNVQYLKEFGWNPIVLTVSNGTFPARDESLLAKIPSDIHVERTHIYEPYDLYKKFTGEKSNTAIDVSVLTTNKGTSLTKKIANAIRSTLFIPDARIGWMLTAVSAGKKLIEEHNIQAIYSSSPPYTCSLIGRALKRATGLPWVAGLRDPWTEFLTTPDRWFLPAAIDKHLEHSVLKEADAVECAWQGIITDALRKYPSLPKQKFHHVPNGFDSADFPTLLPEEQTPTKKFTITYSGSLYGLRNPDTLLRALENLVASNTIDANKLLLRCVGRVGEDVQAKFQQSTLSKCIEIINYLPHQESVKYLMKSNVLLLIVDSAKESKEIVPGKVYEYIGVHKPVLALAPHDSAVAQLLQETNAGVAIEYNNHSHCANYIADLYQRWSSNQPLYSPNLQEIARYERRNATGELARLLHSLTTNA